MLRTIFKGVMTLAIAASVVACFPRKDFNSVGPDFNDRAVLIGNWTVNQVVQNDEGAIAKNFPAKAKYLEISSLFPEVKKVTVNFSGGSDSAFSAANPDNSPIFYLPVGQGFKWRTVDPKDGPRYIEVFKRDASNAITERYRVDFGNPVRSSDGYVVLRFTRRNADGAAYLSYDYLLKK